MSAAAGARYRREGMSSRAIAAVLSAVALALVLCATAGANGRLYVSNATSDALVVVDVDTKATLATIPVGADPDQVAVSPDGTRAYVVVLNTPSPLDNVLAIVDTTSFAVLGSAPVGNYPRNVAVSPDGKRAYVANYGESISVIDTDTRTALQPITGITNFLMSVAISADGARLYWTENNSSITGPRPGALAVSDTTGVVQNRVEILDPGAIALAPVGAKAYVTDVKSGGFTAVDLPTDATPTPVGGSTSTSIAVAPNGARLYVADGVADAVTVRDAATQDVVKTIAVVDPGSIAVTPDGTRALVVSGAGATGVTLIDTATNSDVGTLPLGAGGAFLAGGPTPPAPPPSPPAPPPPPIIESPAPPAIAPSGTTVPATPASRTIRRTVRLRRGCTTAGLRVSGRGVKVTHAKRLARGRCRITLRVASTATGRRDLLVKRGRRTVRLRGAIRL